MVLIIMHNILITGTNGQVGSELKELSVNYKYNFFFTTKDTLDISNKKDVLEFVQE
jgi:dTDP-4-dehydrorhamnose reductase